MGPAEEHSVKCSPIHPGEILNEEFLVPMNITQYRLAKSIGVDPRRRPGRAVDNGRDCTVAFSILRKRGWILDGSAEPI
jgi:addiction module HigA family antidote